ncbi:MAG: hypothetical protein K2I31_02885 [Duncaniella sp.]|nr:hypothetical protein [Duncaniella sp.]
MTPAPLEFVRHPENDTTETLRQPSSTPAEAPAPNPEYPRMLNTPRKSVRGPAP